MGRINTIESCKAGIHAIKGGLRCKVRNGTG